MKNIKYILTILIFLLSLAVWAQKHTGQVLLVDTPVKGAVISANDQVIAETDENGVFKFKGEFDKVTASYKNLETEVELANVVNFNFILVPSEKKVLEMIEEQPSIEKCKVFLANYPDSKDSDKVQEKYEELVFSEAYLNAVKTFEVNKLEAYMNTFKDGKYNARALKTIEAISWQKARLIDSYQGYQEYMAKFPESEASQEAAQRLEDLEK